MKMIRIIYASKMADQVDEQAIQNILSVSRSNNLKSHLTGLLCFGSRQFLQCLEGPKEAVGATYAIIARDERHTSITMLYEHETDSRGFSEWIMGYVPESSMTKALLEKTMTDGRFSPLYLTDESAWHFLQEAKKCIPIV